MLDRIPAGVPISIERVTFPTMLERGGRLYAVHSESYWLDIGTPQKYLEAHGDVLDGRLGLPPAPGAAEVAPNVWVQGRADVDAKATLTGPVLIGEGSVVSEGAVVAGSVLGPLTSIGPRARVERSVLLAGARVGADAATTDAVIGPDASVEERAAVVDVSVVGAAAVVSAGVHMAGARIDPPGL